MVRYTFSCISLQGSSNIWKYHYIQPVPVSGSNWVYFHCQVWSRKTQNSFKVCADLILYKKAYDRRVHFVCAIMVVIVLSVTQHVAITKYKYVYQFLHCARPVQIKGRTDLGQCKNSAYYCDILSWYFPSKYCFVYQGYSNHDNGNVDL